MTVKISTKCIRCGQCCLHIPCWWGQINYRINEANYKTKKCPALKLGIDGKYICLRMVKDKTMQKEMLRTGCHYPKWRKQ